MKNWMAFTINYNDYYWLLNNYKSILNLFDEYVIVDGADIITAQVVQSNGKLPSSALSKEPTLSLYGTIAEEARRLGKVFTLVLPKTFWSSKTEMCNAALAKTSKPFAFQIDADEFYHGKELRDALLSFSKSGKRIGSVNVINFWKNFDTIVCGNMWNVPFIRMFKIEGGYEFGDHRPPNLTNGTDTIDPRTKALVIDSNIIKLYHCGYIGDERIWQKCKYFVKLRPNHPKYSRYIAWYNDVWNLWDTDKAKAEELGLHVTGGGITSAFNGLLPQQIKHGYWPPSYWAKYE